VNGLDNIVMILLLAGLVVSALICVTVQSLVKASIALALVSGIQSIIMFIMGAHLAAVFELSVCSGLITVVFISAISMTKVSSKEELEIKGKARHKRFILLPVLLITLAAFTLVIIWPYMAIFNAYIPAPPNTISEQDMFWNKRQADLLGQILIILVGVYGVLIFFKGHDKQ